MNPIDKLEFDKEYVSGMLLDSEFHAGGLFFCVPYEIVLVFRADGQFEIKKRTVETFRPLDDEDQEINGFHKEGTYGLTDRNYIRCEFKDFVYEVDEGNSLVKKEKTFSLIGLPLEKNPHIFALNSIWNIAFTLKQ